MNDAAYHGSVECAKLLIERGVDVNARNSVCICICIDHMQNGGTPLMSACHNTMHSAEIVQLLIERGADICAKDDVCHYTCVFMK